MKIEFTQIPAARQKDFYAAMDAMHSFQKKGVFNNCLFWPDHCGDPPIASHLLSESWLRQIADSTNHVIRFDLVTNNVARKGASTEPVRVGVGQKTAVTFPGFCQRHDSALFKCLEQCNFSATPQQLLALTYRAACRDFWAKYQMVECHLPKVLDHTAAPLLVNKTANEMANCQRIGRWKQELEMMLQGGENELAAFVVEFETRPTLLASATISFPWTFTGRKLDARYDYLTLSIIPSGATGFGVFTWSKYAAKNPSLLVKSFNSIAKELQPDALVNLILELMEEFFIEPVWWNRLLPSQQHSLLARYSRCFRTGEELPPPGSLLPKPPPIAEWKILKSDYA